MHRNHHSIATLFTILLFATATVCVSAAPWPLSTGFEAPDYALGGLMGQQGWLTSGSVTVQNTEVHSGTQAVELTARSAARYTVTTSDNVVWLEANCKTQPATAYPQLPVDEGASCVLFFLATDGPDTNGITCLDGDGTGSGTWVSTDLQATEWTQIKIRQDYATHTWDLYVDGNPVLTDLGNAWNSRNSFRKWDTYAGETTSMYLDGVSITGEYVSKVPQWTQYR